MARTTTIRHQPCRQCKRRRQRLRAHSPILNTLCAPVSRWGFTVLAVAALYANLGTATLITGTIAAAAWLYS
ncbi:hypothetical protein [Streptomyces spinosirectus]